MICCYILFSEKLNRFYTGASQSDLEQRIFKHNDLSYGIHRFTAKTNDWKLFLVIECLTYSQAIRIERHIKKMKSRSYIHYLYEYPEMVEKLKEKHKL